MTAITAPGLVSEIPLAAGWATVDLDRAATELRPLLEAGTRFEPAADCEPLGARCRIGRAAPDSGAPAAHIVLLEPSTEGRLAATLARHGEGWCATWVYAGTDAGQRKPVFAGPLGPERLVPGGPVHGPHRLLVEATTIAP